MRPQNRRRGHGRDLALHTGLDSLRLPLVGHDADDFARFEDLPHGHGNGSGGYLVSRGEPAFADLLLPALSVERHNQVWLLGVEVRRRIVERQVAILANPDKRHVDGRLGELAANALGDAGGVLFPIEQMIPGDARLGDEAIEEVFAKTGGMIDRQADVLVQVEHLHARPVDGGRRGKRLQKVEL